MVQKVVRCLEGPKSTFNICRHAAQGKHRPPTSYNPMLESISLDASNPRDCAIRQMQ